MIGRQKDIILAVLEAPKSHQKCIGIFSLSGEKQSIQVDLPDGVYKNAITGEDIDIFEKIVAYDGEPIIIL